MHFNHQGNQDKHFPGALCTTLLSSLCHSYKIHYSHLRATLAPSPPVTFLGYLCSHIQIILVSLHVLFPAEPQM